MFKTMSCDGLGIEDVFDIDIGILEMYDQIFFVHTLILSEKQKRKISDRTAGSLHNEEKYIKVYVPMKSTGETSSMIVQQPVCDMVLKLERWVPLFKVESHHRW